VTRPYPQERRFAEHLASLAGREDGDARAALAALRRGLGKTPGEAAEAARYVFPWLHDTASTRQADAYFQVAALFATHQLSWHRGDGDRALNLGGSFRRLAPPDSDDGAGAQRRFVALLNAHPDELDRHLRHAMSLLKSHDVPVDWAQLLRDVQEWTYENRPVQLDWARAFWGGGPAPDEAAQADESTRADATATATSAQPSDLPRTN
jgi:CRISPR system Cascade subunit CasB